MLPNWDVSIALPETMDDGVSHFTDKRYTTKWVAQLPLVAGWQTAGKIRTALEEIVGHRMPYDRRLFFLEQTSPVVTTILRDFLREMHRDGLPLAAVAAEHARTLLELLSLKVVAYRQVLDYLGGSMFAGGLRKGHLLGLTLLRLLEILGEMFEIYRYISIRPATGLWLLYNHVYSIAEAARLLNSRRQRLHGKGKHSISTVFRTQLLLESLHYYDMRYSELERAKVLVESYSRLIEIASKGHSPESYRFCFDLDADAPPTRYRSDPDKVCEEGKNRRVLNLEPMVLALEKIAATDLSEGDVDPFERRLARELLAAWQFDASVRDERLDVASPVRLLQGLSNIVAYIALEQQRGQVLASGGDEVVEMVVEAPQPGEAAFNPEIDGFDPLLHEEKIRTEYDQWSLLPYTPKQSDPGPWADRPSRQAGVELVAGKILNQSQGGFGVEVSQLEGCPHYKSGELVAVEFDDGVLELCAIRWVTAGRESVEMGLIRLGSGLQPHSLMIKRNGQLTQPLPVVLFVHHSGFGAIALHNLNLRAEHQVSLAGSGVLGTEDLLESSPTFLCYRIDETLYQHLIHAD